MRKTEYNVPPVRKRGECMRKTEYNVPPVSLTSRMYAKNRIQCATGIVNEANVCEKPNTICRW